MDNIKEPTRRKKFMVLAVILVVLAVGFSLILVYQPDWVLNEKNNVADIDEATQKIVESQIPELRNKTVAEPNNPDAWRNLGRAEYLLGDSEAAESSLNRAVALNDSNPQFYVDLGGVYEVEGDLAKAEEYYKKAIELNGTEIKAVNSTSEALTAEQLAILEEAGSLKPQPKSYYNLVTPYTALGNLYLRLNKPDEAIRVLESGVAMNPKYPDFYLLLSTAYKKTDNQEKAAEANENFKALVPEFSPAAP